MVANPELVGLDDEGMTEGGGLSWDLDIGAGTWVIVGIGPASEGIEIEG